MRFPFAVMLGLSLPVAAYDIPTHEQLARRTVELATSRGLEYRDLDLHQGPIVFGVASEDSGTPYPRFLHHFYDPDTGFGMPENTYSVAFGGFQGAQFLQRSGRYLSALEWGREAMPDPLDWRASIEAYDDTDVARKNAYNGVGHVLHLLEDMAQPDHARCRPHPGNYLQEHMDILERLAPALAQQARTHVGYERLWHELSDWPRGEKVHPQTSFKGAFDVSAYVSHKGEDDQDLPSRTKREIALGLGPLNISSNLSRIARENVPGSAGPVAGLVARAIHDDLTNAGWLAFRDNLWVQYEINAPIVPTIPWPERDDHTERHVEMGRRLLKLSEEHGAGLLRLYHDIVNPPAYVASVEILQGGQSKYRADWLPATPDPDGHVASRSLSRVRQEVLKWGDFTEVRIRFGPTYEHGGESIREAVGDVLVWAESRTGSRTPVLLSGFTPDPEARGAYMLVGQFNPREGGTLHITGHDLDNHFPRPEGRTGEELDSDPATPARATWGDSEDGSPYPFTGYESGRDTNHPFRVGEGPCLTVPRFGAWSGEVSMTYESRSEGGTVKASGTGSVTFRSIMEYQCHPRSQRLVFGGGGGSFHKKEAWSGEGVGIDGRREEGTATAEGTFDASGHIQLSTGSYILHVNELREAVSPGSRGLEAPIMGAVGEGTVAACELPNISGQIAGPGSSIGRRFGGGLLESRQVLSWSIGFGKEEHPPHTEVCPSDCYPASYLLLAVRHYVDRVGAIAWPAIQSLNAAQHPREMQMMLEARRELADLARRSSYYDRDFEEPIHSLCGQAPRTWLRQDPSYGDVVREATEKKHQAEQWKEALKVSAVAITNRIAEAAEQQAPQAATALRGLSQRLSDGGWTAFGSR